jgi:hypothetical protein
VTQATALTPELAAELREQLTLVTDTIVASSKARRRNDMQAKMADSVRRRDE